MTMTPLRRRTAALAAAALTAALLLTACGSDSDSSGSTTSGSMTSSTVSKTRSVKADNGTVTVPADPKRVAVLGNAVQPYLDLGGKPVAVTDLNGSALADLPSDQQAAVKAATSVGASGGAADLEKLAALKPDVIVIAIPDSDWAKLKDKLAAIAPTIWLGFDSDWKFRANALAEATNEIDANNTQKATYDDLVTQIKQKYGETLKSKKIVEAARYDGQDSGPLGTFGINTSLCAEVARDEGIVDFAATVQSASFEQISSLAKYDLILYTADNDGQPAEAMAPLMATGAWKALPAVQAGHAQPTYCPYARSFGLMAQYLEEVKRAVSTLPKS